MAKKNPAAQALGQLGGKARAKALSPAKLSEIGRKGAQARQKKLTAAERSKIAKKAVQARIAKTKAKTAGNWMGTRGPKGCIYQRPDSSVWWIKYSLNGKSFRESTHSEDKRKANKLLQRRLGEIGTGAFVGPEVDKVTVQELADDYLRDYRINGKKRSSTLSFVGLSTCDRSLEFTELGR
jgi:general stress protein YciG